MNIKATFLTLGLSLMTVAAVAAETTMQEKSSVSKNLYFADKDMKFSDTDMPPVRRNAMVVPTFKIQESKRLTQEGQLVSESTHMDAAGMEFRRGEIEPVKRQLQLDRAKDQKTSPQVVRKVDSESGVVTSDVVILEGQN